jgi:prepilin-type N-terminal cleavage/methylation domain-containing protein
VILVKRGFTLIELLIVVAIIAILAAIAVPNFLEAQTRAKVSRAKADIRSLATALEAYSVDNNKYPPDITTTDGYTVGAGYYWYISNWVTSPVAYITNNLLLDPFRDKRTTLPDVYKRFRYMNYGMYPYYLANGVPGGASTAAVYLQASTVFGTWRLSSSGPDASAGPWSPLSSWPSNGVYFPSTVIIYDPTNGTISPGDIVRSQAMSEQIQTPYQL